MKKYKNLMSFELTFSLAKHGDVQCQPDKTVDLPSENHHVKALEAQKYIECVGEATAPEARKADPQKPVDAKAAAVETKSPTNQSK